MNHLTRAKKLASNSLFTRAKVGAVIIKGGRVLATGINSLRYTKDNGRSWPSMHAEEQAILKLLKQPNGGKHLIGSVIYISRVKKDGSVGLAKPCRECQELIDAVGIRKIVYTEG